MTSGEFFRGSRAVESGHYQGWRTWEGQGGDPFETHIGPLMAMFENGNVRCAFEPRVEHLNGSGNIHGGALMAFADFAIFCIVAPFIGDTRVVT
ncbi:MAG: PaaI family thioesterase, partial [Caulobacterales bacterium]